MKATETNLLQLLGGNKTQFSIPIYQRPYSWTLTQCRQLWDDVVRIVEDDSITGHFVGSLVYLMDGCFNAGSITELLVIDGQQRLTTITLLLSALRKAIKSSNTETIVSCAEIEDSYLFNKYSRDDERYKLLLNRKDRETLICLLEARDLPKHESQRLIENYHFFENQIRKQGIEPDSLYRGIGKLIVVNVSLERGRDDPQLIFESLNSTGLDLSQADMIRNFVLMGLSLDIQERIYNNYWYRMEQSFDRAGSPELFDRFMRDYLTFKSKSGAIPVLREVYATFKTHVREQKGTSIEDIVKDVYHYSKYFGKLTFDQEPDPKIQQALSDIRTLKVDVAYPFLLQVYEDYSQNLLSKQEFTEVLRLIESYVFRRAICGIPTNSMNKTFSTLSREIDRSISGYLESIKQAFIKKTAYQRFPDDAEFRREFIVKDVYNFRSRNYLLQKLENTLNTQFSRPSLDGLTIEHIMPQNPNLSQEWREMLGETVWKQVQAQYLHTIGNLTLTAYNSEMGDLPFEDKLELTKDGRYIGLKSPLCLNNEVKDQDKWDESTIQHRAECLADEAVKAWAYPQVSS